jgi:hypothetical protein
MREIFLNVSHQLTILHSHPTSSDRNAVSTLRARSQHISLVGSRWTPAETNTSIILKGKRIFSLPRFSDEGKDRRASGPSTHHRSHQSSLRDGTVLTIAHVEVIEHPDADEV